MSGPWLQLLLCFCWAALLSDEDVSQRVVSDGIMNFQEARAHHKPFTNPTITLECTFLAWSSLLWMCSTTDLFFFILWGGRGKVKPKHAVCYFLTGKMMGEKESQIIIVHYFVHVVHWWWQYNNQNRCEVGNWAAYSNYYQKYASKTGYNYCKSSVT